MIINKQGEKCLCSNGVEYIIGEEVIGTENGDYEGLIGRIYEIRIGEAESLKKDFPKYTAVLKV